MQDFQSHTPHTVRLVNAPCYQPETRQALARLFGVRSGGPAAISYGFIFDPDETFTHATDTISALTLSQNGPAFGPVADLDLEDRHVAAMAIAMLIADGAFHDLMLTEIVAQAKHGIHELYLQGPVDAICLPGGVIVEAFDDHWPARGQRDLAPLINRRFFAISDSGGSNHERLRFKTEAEAYLEERLFALTVADPHTSGARRAALPRDQVALLCPT